ncbi:pirin family protein [Mucilaginibacter sp. 14171R-50]|uniref:pirin family protein n=1 Tax=Mucilaginibacter sp. 14171R-50 TaxID=2703789 RepID=UPI00138D8B63|nr:pirin family protein [Mucilaginibacter sp. 14171R-50]QHS54924.1 pirin family protein [Mucilaginibacter sp. 14171R-50]
MKTVFHPANERGHNDIGWLKANFSFSFGPYHNPDKVHFGALRVLNDDTIAQGMGFGSHPHDNMEITTIVLEGAVEHKDSMGNKGIIKPGDVQVMSAGTGVVHSEYNPSQTEPAKALQIWVFPKLRNIQPRYDQKNFSDVMVQNQFTTMISPVKSEETLWLNQDTTFSQGKFDAGQKVDYTMKTAGNGVYVFLIDGNATIAGSVLNKRDAIGVYDTNTFTIETNSESRILIIEVPML